MAMAPLKVHSWCAERVARQGRCMDTELRNWTEMQCQTHLHSNSTTHTRVLTHTQPRTQHIHRRMETRLRKGAGAAPPYHMHVQRVNRKWCRQYSHYRPPSPHTQQPSRLVHKPITQVMNDERPEPNAREQPPKLWEHHQKHQKAQTSKDTRSRVHVRRRTYPICLPMQEIQPADGQAKCFRKRSVLLHYYNTFAVWRTMMA